MGNLLFILAILFMFLTLFVCTLGIVLMARGGETNKNLGTKLMAARVYLQAIALVLVAIAFNYK